MIGQDLVVKVGMQILLDPSVQSKIHVVAIKGLTAVCKFITPYIIPALIVVGVVLSAVAILLFTVEVAKWIMANLA